MDRTIGVSAVSLIGTETGGEGGGVGIVGISALTMSRIKETLMDGAVAGTYCVMLVIIVLVGVV